MEPILDEKIRLWLRRLSHQSVSESEAYKSFDIGKSIEYLTVDVTTKIFLGRDPDYVSAEADAIGFLDTVKYGNAISQYLGVLVESNALLRFALRVPILGRLLAIKPEDPKGIGPLSKVSARMLTPLSWS